MVKTSHFDRIEIFLIVKKAIKSAWSKLLTGTHQSVNTKYLQLTNIYAIGQQNDCKGSCYRST